MVFMSCPPSRFGFLSAWKQARRAEKPACHRACEGNGLPVDRAARAAKLRGVSVGKRTGNEEAGRLSETETGRIDPARSGGQTEGVLAKGGVTGWPRLRA